MIFCYADDSQPHRVNRQAAELRHPMRVEACAVCFGRRWVYVYAAGLWSRSTTSLRVVCPACDGRGTKPVVRQARP